MSLDKQNIGTLTVRVQGMPEPVKFGEWKWDHFWSTISYEDGASAKRKFFTNGVGQQINGGARSLTEVDTNVPRAGDNGLPNDWEMFVFSMRFRILRVVGVDEGEKPQDFDDDSLNSETPNRRMWFELMRKCLLSFDVNGKTRSIGLPWDYPQAGGITLFSTTIGENFANNGVPSPRDGFQFVIPIHLRANVSFTVACAPVVALALAQAQTVNDQLSTVVEPQVQIEGLVKVAVV